MQDVGGLSNNFVEWRKSYDEKFITWQLENESDLFKHLNLKRIMEHNGDDQQLEEKERVFFKFYANTFKMETKSTLLTLPVSYFGYKFYLEHAKLMKYIPAYNKALLKLVIIGLPSLNYYLVTIYRRYFYKHPYEAELKLKYNEELRLMRKVQNNMEKKDSDKKVKN